MCSGARSPGLTSYVPMTSGFCVILTQQKWGKSGKWLKKRIQSAQHANIVTPDAKRVGKWAVNTTGLGTI